MTDHLINQINEYVGQDDILFNLGDFLFKNHKLIPEARSRIVCNTIHHVMGNHDHHIHKYKDCFASVSDDVELSIANSGDLFILHHYAKRTWFASHKGSYHLYGHCLDIDTELLTQRGWVFRKDLLTDDLCYSYNPDTKKGEFKPIEKIYDYNYNGIMYNHNTQNTNIRCTEKHRFLLETPESKRLEYILAKNLSSQQRRIICAAKSENEGLKISDDFLRLYVWINADGSFENKSLVRFHLKKKRKIDVLKRLLDNLDIKYSENPTKEGCVKINFKLPTALSEYSFKPIDEKFTKLSENQVKVFFDEYAITDGYKTSENCLQIYSCREKEIDILQIICTTNGFRCNKLERTRSSLKGWIISINFDKDKSLINFKNHILVQELVQNEPVWCINTEYSNFLIRRKGKVHFTGNSHDSLDRHPNEPYGKSMDVGVDSAYRIFGEYRPFHITEIKQILNKRSTKFVDHHESGTNIK